MKKKDQVLGYSMQFGRVVVLGMSKTAFARWIWKNDVDSGHPGFRWIFDRISVTGNEREVETARKNPGKVMLMNERRKEG